MAGKTKQASSEDTSSGSMNESVYDVDSIDLMDEDVIDVLRLFVTFTVGMGFFLFPMNWNGQPTTPLGAFASFTTNNFPYLVELFMISLIILTGVLTIFSELYYRKMFIKEQRIADALNLEYWHTSPIFSFLRIFAIVVGVLLFLDVGPEWLLSPEVGELMWNNILPPIVVVIPVAAVFVNYVSDFGGLDLMGTLARPLMKPLFHLPGRASLDAAASWFGSFSVGYFLTRKVFDSGGYHKRHVYILCTCFATASIGILAVITGILNMASYFGLIAIVQLICTGVIAAIVIRIPPLSNISEDFIVDPDPEKDFSGSLLEYLRLGINKGVETSKEKTTIIESTIEGIIDGIKLTATLTGTVLVIGLFALALNTYTPIFEIASRPLVPVLSLLGIPEPQIAATAIIAGYAEVITAASLAAGASLITKFFVTVVVASQAIFLAAPVPIMMDMFEDVPIRFRDLTALFVIRTLLLIPIAALATHVLVVLGLL